MHAVAIAGLASTSGGCDVLPTMPCSGNSREHSSKYPWEKDLFVDLLFQKEFPTNPLNAVIEASATSYLISFLLHNFNNNSQAKQLSSVGCYRREQSRLSLVTPSLVGPCRDVD